MGEIDSLDDKRIGDPPGGTQSPATGNRETGEKTFAQNRPKESGLGECRETGSVPRR